MRSFCRNRVDYHYDGTTIRYFHLIAIYFVCFSSICCEICKCDSDTFVFPDAAVNSYPKTSRSYRTGNNNYYRSSSYPNSQQQQQQQRQPNEIPLELIRKMNTVNDEKQLLSEFVEDMPEEIAFASVAGTYGSGRVAGGDGGGIINRFGGGNSRDEDQPPIERKSTLIPTSAKCQPELRTVSLRDSNDPTLYYIPSCTRVDRCGGCCSHDLLSCQPITIEFLNFTVTVAQYVGGSKLVYKGKKIISVEQHTKCKCDCVVKPKDCTSLQKYEDCRCVCTNKDEEAKCVKDDSKKLWNPSICSCQCREVKECSTGYYFDTVSCSCIASPKRPYFSDIDQTRYKIGYL